MQQPPVEDRVAIRSRRYRLHRCRPLRLKARWTIFLAALVPWLVGLGIAVTVMLWLFWVSDLMS